MISGNRSVKRTPLFLVSSMTMTAVGDAAFDMIREIRRQFKEIPGLLEGTGEPDTDRCVEIATTAALKRMVPPGVLAVGAPVVVGFTGRYLCLSARWLR